MEGREQPDGFGPAEEFENACYQAIAKCRRLPFKYNPTAWITMMNRHGAVEAAKRLLANGDMQSGFERLVREGHPELTVESMVCEPYWERLFTDREREAARWRLEQAESL